MNEDYRDNPKLKSNTRVFKLEVIDGKKPKSSTGLIDPRVFSGENNFAAVRDSRNIWSFKVKAGGLPEALKSKYTTFENLYEYAVKYFAGRNMKITEVID